MRYPATCDTGAIAVVPVQEERISAEPVSAGTSTITVTVVLFADLRRHLPKGEAGPLRLAVPRGATVAELCSTIGIGDLEEVTAGINGEQAPHDASLQDGDEVTLFSPMEGG